MATTTPNLGLTLPIGSEKVSRQILNGNFSLIDTAYGTLNSKMAKRNVIIATSLEIQANSAKRTETSYNVGTGILPYILGYNDSKWMNVTLTLMKTSNDKINVVAYNHNSSAVTIDIGATIWGEV